MHARADGAALRVFCAAPQNAIARDDRWPRLVVYPEGNTCNGRQLCGFKARLNKPILINSLTV
jgi:hypothetical protein